MCWLYLFYYVFCFLWRGIQGTANRWNLPTWAAFPFCSNALEVGFNCFVEVGRSSWWKDEASDSLRSFGRRLSSDHKAELARLANSLGCTQLALLQATFGSGCWTCGFGPLLTFIDFQYVCMTTSCCFYTQSILSKQNGFKMFHAILQNIVVVESFLSTQAPKIISKNIAAFQQSVQRLVKTGIDISDQLPAHQNLSKPLQNRGISRKRALEEQSWSSCLQR